MPVWGTVLHWSSGFHFLPFRTVDLETPVLNSATVYEKPKPHGEATATANIKSHPCEGAILEVQPWLAIQMTEAPADALPKLHEQAKPEPPTEPSQLTECKR